MTTTTNATGSVTPTKARLNPGRQWVGIRNLEFIEEVQPRAGLDRGWVNDLSKFRLEGSEFPPIKVFQTPDGRLIPGEGHHRSMAMASAGEDQILCDIVDGTMEDAIVFAAGSNKSNGVKPMGPKDITKAVEMLLAIDEWWNRTDTWIANYIGCSPAKVGGIRQRFSVRENKPMPDYVVNVKGKQRHRKIASGSKSRKISAVRKTRDGDSQYKATYKGKSYTGNSVEAVQVKLDEAMSQEPQRLDIGDGATSLLYRHGFESVFHKDFGSTTELTGFSRRGIICVPCDFLSSKSLPLAIGQLVAAHEYKGDTSARMIILCYPEDGPAKIIDLYRCKGFEFLTPEELAESLKASGDSSSQT